MRKPFQKGTHGGWLGAGDLNLRQAGVLYPWVAVTSGRPRRDLDPYHTCQVSESGGFGLDKLQAYQDWKLKRHDWPLKRALKKT